MHINPKTGKVQYATAHDLRRPFGKRWAKRITTPVLMRHEKIQSAMAYYFSLKGNEIAEELWGVGSVAASGPDSVAG